MLAVRANGNNGSIYVYVGILYKIKLLFSFTKREIQLKTAKFDSD